MPRPHKCRRIQGGPEFNYFKPRGVPLRSLDEVNLTLDEFEAIRLAYLESLYQEDAAERMGISRQTFGNILNSAHQKIADCLVNGKAMKIEGGVFRMEGKRLFKCSTCGHDWALDYGTGRPPECPECRSRNIHRAPQDRGHSFRTGRQRRGRIMSGGYSK